jgi:hypothetical protein
MQMKACPDNQRRLFPLQIMRHVFTHPEEARVKGLKARQRMVSTYSQEVVGRQLAAELKRLDAKARSPECTLCFAGGKAHALNTTPPLHDASGNLVVQ